MLNTLGSLVSFMLISREESNDRLVISALNAERDIHLVTFWHVIGFFCSFLLMFFDFGFALHWHFLCMVVCTLTSIVCGSAIYKDLFSSLRSMNISYTQYGALGSLLLWFTAWCEYLFNLAICSHGLHCPMLVTGILVLQRYFIQKINGSRVALTLDNKMYTCEKYENGKYVKKHVLELKKGDKVKISRFGICPKGKILSETAQLSHENITGDYDYKSFQYGEPCHAFSISQCDSLELEVIDSIELNDNMINQLEKKK